MSRNIGIVRIQFRTASKRAFRRRPVALIIYLDRGEWIVGVNQSLIQGQRFFDGAFCFRPFAWRQNSVGRTKGVIQTKSSVSWRITRIELDRLLEIITDSFVSWREKFQSMIPSF